MKHKRVYKYRFSPTEEQRKILAHTFGCVRFVYNWALRKKTDFYYKDHQPLYYNELSFMLTELKKQPPYSWLSDVSAVPLQQSLRRLDRAFQNIHAVGFTVLQACGEAVRPGAVKAKSGKPQ